jgi:hypothetical protein
VTTRARLFLILTFALLSPASCGGGDNHAILSPIPPGLYRRITHNGFFTVKIAPDGSVTEYLSSESSARDKSTLLMTGKLVVTPTGIDYRKDSGEPVLHGIQFKNGHLFWTFFGTTPEDEFRPIAPDAP